MYKIFAYCNWYGIVRSQQCFLVLIYYLFLFVFGFDLLVLSALFILFLLFSLNF